jgi:15-cis-phytoene synthase
VEASLAASYRRCELLHRHHGRTYYLATRLLPGWKRPHVHALYGFARYADEIVDRTDDLPVTQRAEKLRQWSDRFLAGLDGQDVTDPVLPAVLHTIRTFNLDRSDFASFLRSMAMDLEIGEYRDYDALLDYMEGSAAVIGTMMLPLLEPTDARYAREPARQLGLAFQLTNFIRDVGEDLARGRIYLPREDCEQFGVTRERLQRCAERGTADAAVRALVRYEIDRARAHYAAAAPGVPMLAPTSQACIRTAFHLYAAILEEVRHSGYDVLAHRAVVPGWRRLRVASQCVLTPPGTPIMALAAA